MRLLLVLLLLAPLAARAEEYAMPNAEGGQVVLTDTPCLYDYSEQFPWYTYATETGIKK